MNSFKPVVVIFLLALARQSVSGDMGVIGPTYQIQEDDAVEVIIKRLEEKQKTGELKRLQEDAIRRSLYSIDHLKPAEHIEAADHRTSRLIDPTITYQKNVTDDFGNVLVAAGTVVNPLEYISLSKELVFFDGADPEQVAAVGKIIKLGQVRLKPILINGEWRPLTKSWKRQVYFDQNGVLVKKFKITQVPAVVKQFGNKLLVEEIPAGELK